MFNGLNMIMRVCDACSFRGMLSRARSGHIFCSPPPPALFFQRSPHFCSPRPPVLFFQRSMPIHHVMSDVPNHPMQFGDRTRFLHKCFVCARQAEFWGNIGGQCVRCFHWTLRSDVKTTLRFLARQGGKRARIQNLPETCRALVLDYVSGSVMELARQLQRYVNMTVWKSILLGRCEDIVSDSEETDDMYFARLVSLPETPLMWKLQLTFSPRYSTCGISGDNLIHYLLLFLAGSDLSGCGPNLNETVKIAVR